MAAVCDTYLTVLERRVGDLLADCRCGRCLRTRVTAARLGRPKRRLGVARSTPSERVGVDGASPAVLAVEPAPRISTPAWASVP
jgi:hypothetical protein